MDAPPQVTGPGPAVRRTAGRNPACCLNRRL